MKMITEKFRKDLDGVLAQFINENITIEHRKTLTDFNVIEFIGWVSKKIEEDKK